ncbi:MAG: hypothetical protein ACUVSK_00005 [Desulfotomaculales bacterium]
MGASPAVRTILRLLGLGLILLGAIGKLAPPWPVIAILAGIAVFLAGGGPGG